MKKGSDKLHFMKCLTAGVTIFMLLWIGSVWKTDYRDAEAAVSYDASQRYDWVGLSTDTKPSTSKNGATFFEMDTDIVFVYNGSAWVCPAFATSGIDTLATADSTGTVLFARGTSHVDAVIWGAEDASIDIDYTVEGRIGTAPWFNLDSAGASNLLIAGADSAIVDSYTVRVDSVRVKTYAVSADDTLFAVLRVGKDE